MEFDLSNYNFQSLDVIAYYYEEKLWLLHKTKNGNIREDLTSGHYLLPDDPSLQSVTFGPLPKHINKEHKLGHRQLLYQYTVGIRAYYRSLYQYNVAAG